MAESYMGWEVTVKKKDGDDASYSTVGKAQAMDFEISSDNTRVYSVGFRDPRVIKEGRREISGSLTHLIINDNYLNGINETCQDAWSLRANIAGDKRVTLTGVKFSNWSLDIPQDGDVVETIDFEATGVTWEDI